MRVKRVLVLAAFAAAALGAAQPAAADHDCDEYPNNHCYDCVQAPCYPEDYPPYLLRLIFGEPDR
ncbi:MAG TPA: hypothetical protein VNA20_01220 [Frankiaceae bacterium]|nr:hypothetical protein [Frankiaceae bacterium]